MKKRPVTCLIAATLFEAEPYIKSLKMEQIEKEPFDIYRAKDKLLVICGIGKANAAMGTTYCCTKYQPDLIINAGAAGAVDEKCDVDQKRFKHCH